MLTRGLTVAVVGGVAAAAGTLVVGVEVVDTIRLVEAGPVVTIQVAVVDIIHLLVEAVVDTAVHVEEAAAAEVAMVLVAPTVRLRVPVPAPAVPGEYTKDQNSLNFLKRHLSILVSPNNHDLPISLLKEVSSVTYNIIMVMINKVDILSPIF
jgi:hypothetical protein